LELWDSWDIAVFLPALQDNSGEVSTIDVDFLFILIWSVISIDFVVVDVSSLELASGKVSLLSSSLQEEETIGGWEGILILSFVFQVGSGSKDNVFIVTSLLGDVC